MRFPWQTATSLDDFQIVDALAEAIHHAEVGRSEYQDGDIAHAMVSWYVVMFLSWVTRCA